MDPSIAIASRMPLDRYSKVSQYQNMLSKTPFVNEKPTKILKVLLLAFFFAVFAPCLVWLADQIIGPSFDSWKAYAIFAPLGFCGCLAFYDDKYTGLRLLGTITGVVAGIITTVQISDGDPFNPFAHLFIGTTWGFLGYFMVGYYNLIYYRWHW